MGNRERNRINFFVGFWDSGDPARIERHVEFCSLTDGNIHVLDE